MRGGTAIQSATFGILRASEKLAESAVREPDDMGELEHLSRQLMRAMKQLNKILDRAER